MSGEANEREGISAEGRARVELLDQVWTSWSNLGATLDETAWKAPSDCPGWTVQDALVHLTATERMLLGDPLPEGDVPDDLPHVRNDVGRINERWIESRRSWTGADALDEFRAATAARLEVLRGLDADGFARETWTPVGRGTVTAQIGFRLFDSWVHEQDVRAALDRPGDGDSAAARFAVGMMLDVLPYTVGKKVGAPDGSTVVLTLTGPVARTVAVRMTGGRAHPLDDVPDDPTSAVTLASDVYERLATGRRDPDAALMSGAVRIEGDVELGGRVVHELNHMF